jgi:phosphoglycolate phosphatase
MPKAVDLMMFDFDGTLADTKDDLVTSVNHTLTRLNLQPRTPVDIISFVGDGVRQLIERSLSANRDAYIDQAMTIFTDYYARHLVDQTRLYPDVEDLLNHFSHKIKIIVTNKRYRFTKTIAAHLGIEKYFQEIVGADTTSYQKPDARVIEYVLNRYKVPRSKAVMIGDGKNDAAVAANAGIVCCVHLNGLGAREELLAMNADYYCENMSEIKSLFC